MDRLQAVAVRFPPPLLLYSPLIPSACKPSFLCPLLFEPGHVLVGGEVLFAAQKAPQGRWILEVVVLAGRGAADQEKRGSSGTELPLSTPSQSRSIQPHGCVPKQKRELTTTVTSHLPSPTLLSNPLVLVSLAKSISHSPQISKASSRQALKDSSSMIVGWAISLPGKTPQVTASTSPRERLDS